jgi:hypothetical protein
MSQLTKPAQTTSIEAQLEASGLTPDTDEFAAASAMVRSGASIDDAATKYGGNPTPTSAIATQQSATPAVRPQKATKAVNLQATPVIPAANSQYATNDELAQVEETAFNAGVNLAATIGSTNRTSFADGFLNQATVEAKASENFRSGLVSGLISSL